MTATTFPRVTLASSETGATAKGELVLEHSLHYQVAVAGRVRAFAKSEWVRTDDSLGSVFGPTFEDYLGGMR